MGAAIDVRYDYQPEPDTDGRTFPCHWPFLELDNVVLSPRRAASLFYDLGRWDDVIENTGRLASGRTDFLNCADLDQGY